MTLLGAGAFQANGPVLNFAVPPLNLAVILSRRTLIFNQSGHKALEELVPSVVLIGHMWRREFITLLGGTDTATLALLSINADQMSVA